MTDLLIWGIVAHLVADWLFQNDWMAANKADLRHPAAWVHAGVHFVAMAPVFPLAWALVLAVSHAVIDTRKPLIWWRRVFRQTTEGPAAIHVAFWGDQVTHIALIALIAGLLGA